MDELKYLLDDEPISARNLIKLAGVLDQNFANDWLRQTSVAASIIRNHGYTVCENPDYRPNVKED